MVHGGIKKKKTRHKWPAFVLKNTFLCQQMTIFFDPYLWGSLGPPETPGLLGLLELPWASPWELRIKKKIVGIFMFHMLKTL